MSADADGPDDEQAVRFTIREGLVLRGAINVAWELLDRPGFDTTQFPITRGQHDMLERLSGVIDNRMQDQIVTNRGSFREPLEPAQAQAVRDVVGTLEMLLDTPDGRQTLVEVGFLHDADQPVDQAEVDLLQSIQDKIDPTGVRPAPSPADEPDQREAGELVDPTASVDANIQRAIDDIADHTILWPGDEQALFKIQNIQEATVEQRDLSCRMWALNVIETVMLVVGSRRHIEDDVTLRITIVDEADIAMGGLIGEMTAQGCLSEADQDSLLALYNNIVDIRARRTDTNLTGGAERFLRDFQEAINREAATEAEMRDEQAAEVVQGLRALEDNLIEIQGTIDPDEADTVLLDATESTRGDAEAAICVEFYELLGDILENLVGAVGPREMAMDQQLLRRFEGVHERLLQFMREAGCINNFEAEELRDFFRDTTEFVRERDSVAMRRAAANYIDQLIAAVETPRDDRGRHR